MGHDVLDYHLFPLWMADQDEPMPAELVHAGKSDPHLPGDSLRYPRGAGGIETVQLPEDVGLFSRR